MSYKPQVDDYVKWKNNLEGWVYFQCNSYITIEMLVRPKDEINFQCCSLHRNERVLLLCFRDQWIELEYIKSRKVI